MSGATINQAGADAASATGRRGGRAVALRAAQVVLGLFYAFSATPKLISHSSAVESFDRMGWSHGAMYVVGGLEMAGAIALLIIPALASAAAIGYIGLMIGASTVQLTLLDPENAVMPLVLIVPLVLIARARRHHASGLAALVRRRA